MVFNYSLAYVREQEYIACEKVAIVTAAATIASKVVASHSKRWNLFARFISAADLAASVMPFSNSNQTQNIMGNKFPFYEKGKNKKEKKATTERMPFAIIHIITMVP